MTNHILTPFNQFLQEIKEKLTLVEDYLPVFVRHNWENHPVVTQALTELLGNESHATYVINKYLYTSANPKGYKSEVAFVFEFFHEMYGHGDTIPKNDLTDCLNSNGGINYEAFALNSLDDIFTALWINDRAYIFVCNPNRREITNEF